MVIKRKDKKYNKKHPEQGVARMYTQRSNLRRDKCEYEGCDSTENWEGHHPDYSKPWWVITLCQKHHNNVKVIQRKLLEAIRQSNNLKMIITC